MVTVRKALSKDIESIAKFQVEMAWETEHFRLDPQTVRKGVEAVFADENKGQYLVAECNSQVIGSALTVYEWSDWRNGTVLWIHSVYVHKDFRRQGVFKNIYLHVKNIVNTRQDLKGIRLYVDKTNLLAQKVYKSLEMNGDHYRLFEWMKE